jgi:hypothetical protein
MTRQQLSQYFLQKIRTLTSAQGLRDALNAAVDFCLSQGGGPSGVTYTDEQAVAANAPAIQALQDSFGAQLEAITGLDTTQTEALQGLQAALAEDDDLLAGLLSTQQQQATQLGILLSKPAVTVAYPAADSTPAALLGVCTHMFSNGTQLVMSWRYELPIRYATTGAVFYWPNWGLGNEAEQRGLNDITVRAGLYNGGVIYPFTWQGASFVRIAPGATVLNDPYPYRLPVGNCYLTVSVTVDTLGQKWPIGLTSIASANSEESITGNLPLGGQPGYHPFAMTGTPLSAHVKESVILVADSLGEGLTDATDQGYLRRGLDAQLVPWTRFALSGAQFSTFTGINSSLVLSNLVGGGIILTELGINTVGNYNSLAEAQAAFTAWWQILAATGRQVWQTTLTPRQEFSASQVALLAAVNDWIRTVPAPLSGVVEVADLAMTSRNSNMWKPGYSDDGLHANRTGAAALGAAITPALFLR